MDELIRPTDLATILAATRHLDRIDLKWHGTAELSLVRSGGRLTRLSDEGGGSDSEERTFGGTILLATAAESQEIRFSGIETLAADANLRAIKDDPDWPSTLTLENEKVLEKALPHGAGLIVRGPSMTPGLALDWGVFLPTGERPAVTIGLVPTGEPPLAVRLFLHGYFFVDSGRRAILGLAEDGADGGGTEGTLVPVRWNRALRDHTVLAWLPRLLLCALEDGVLSADDLTHLARALAQSPWFASHGAAIGRRFILAQIWDGRALAWTVLESPAALRALPAGLLDTPTELRALLPDLDAFAVRRGFTICAAGEDGSAHVLATEAPGWGATELAELLEMVPPQAFRQQKHAAAVAEILDGTRLGPDAQGAIGAVLRRKLREAINLDGARFPADEIMQAVVRHVPAGTVVFLPERATHSAILRAFALSPADALVVGDQWQTAGAKSILTNRGHLAQLLRAIEPLAESDQESGRAEQAAAAAMTLIRASGAALSTLANDGDLRSIRLFPVVQQPEDARRVLSIRDLADAADQGSLFLGTPITYRHVKLLLAALPGLSLSIIPPREKELFDSVPGMEGRGGDLDHATMVRIVNAAKRFNDDARARGALVEKIRQPWTQDAAQVAALRRLLVGVAEGGQTSAKLYQGVPPGLAPLVERLLRGDALAFLVADSILAELAMRERDALALIPLDRPEFERRLDDALGRGHFEASEEEGWLLLGYGLSTELLRRLPIHELEAGDAPSSTTRCVSPPTDWFPTRSALSCAACGEDRARKRSRRKANSFRHMTPSPSCGQPCGACAGAPPPWIPSNTPSSTRSPTLARS